MAYTPMKLTARMPGTISQPGTDSTLEKTRTIGTFMMNNITLAMNSDAIKPQTNSGLVSNSTGPGVMLYRVSAPIITAVVPEPGTPSVSMGTRSEEHTSELQSLMRTSYAVFCLKKKKK